MYFKIQKVEGIDMKKCLICFLKCFLAKILNTAINVREVLFFAPYLHTKMSVKEEILLVFLKTSRIFKKIKCSD